MIKAETVRRLQRLVDPIHVVTYQCDEPTDALMALGHRNYWDGYFAGRAAPLGRVPAGVVHAVFYNFANGEVARHVPVSGIRPLPKRRSPLASKAAPPH